MPTSPRMIARLLFSRFQVVPKSPGRISERSAPATKNLIPFDMGPEPRVKPVIDGVLPRCILWPRISPRTSRSALGLVVPMPIWPRSLTNRSSLIG